LAYIEKIYHFGSLVSQIRDSRLKPQIETSLVVKSVFLMMLGQMGSLHALEQERGNPFWGRWLGRKLASADTTARVYTGIRAKDIRLTLHCVYTGLKRNKMLKRRHRFHVLILDGHESSASYLRCCQGCRQRRIKTQNEGRVQFYHRQVIAMLSEEKFPLLLDVESQREGEDEVNCALRLMERVLKNYPRSFDVVVADALYLRANFFNLLLDHHKDVIAVLKDDRRELLQDAEGLFAYEEPLVKQEGTTKREMWDIEQFESWESLGRKVRVVRSLETKTVRRQMTGQKEEKTSEWIWATTLSKKKASTQTIIYLGHDRWLIENRAINELVTFWHADHVYRHHPQAIVSFLLTLFLVLNLFRAFLHLNIKPERRAKHTTLYFARLIFAGISENIFNKAPP